VGWFASLVSKSKLFVQQMSLYPSTSASASKAKRRSVATRGPEQLSDEQRQEVKEAFELFDGDKVNCFLSYCSTVPDLVCPPRTGISTTMNSRWPCAHSGSTSRRQKCSKS
jgi:hypothetical protein